MADQAMQELLEIRRRQQEKEQESLDNAVAQSQASLQSRIELARRDPSLNIQEWDEPGKKEEAKE